MKQRSEKDKKFIKLQNYYLENRTEVVPQCSKTMPEGNVKNCSRMTQVAETEEIHKCFCSVYIFPDRKWKNKDCPMADEFLKNPPEETKKEIKRAGQQKQKKKAK